MLLEEFGVLSTAQDLTDGATISENVIDLGTILNVGFTDLWLAIETETKIGGSAGTTSTYRLDLVVAKEAALTNVRNIVTIDIANDDADPRIAAVNRNIAACEVGQMVGEAADADYKFLGLVLVLADGNGTATLSINAAVSPSKPRTKDNTQVIRSNVGLPS